MKALPTKHKKHIETIWMYTRIYTCIENISIFQDWALAQGTGGWFSKRGGLT